LARGSVGSCTKDGLCNRSRPLCDKQNGEITAARADARFICIAFESRVAARPLERGLSIVSRSLGRFEDTIYETSGSAGSGDVLPLPSGRERPQHHVLIVMAPKEPIAIVAADQVRLVP